MKSRSREFDVSAWVTSSWPCPCSHVWFFKGTAQPHRPLARHDRLRELERVLYFEAYVTIDPGDAPLKERELLTEEKFRQLQQEYPGSSSP